LSVLFLFYFLSRSCYIVSPVSVIYRNRTDNRTEIGQTIEQTQERQYNRNSTDNRTETGQTIEQEKDIQYSRNRTNNRTETGQKIEKNKTDNTAETG
jgi:uncharacterized protein YjaG (DUF416 family)